MKIEIYPVAPEFGGEYMNLCVKEASRDLPNWYKESESYAGDPKDNKRLHARMTVKKCLPVLDYLSLGINLYLPFGLHAYGTYPEREVYSSADDRPTSNLCGLSRHAQEQIQKFPLPDRFDPQPYKINFPYVIKTPKDYSTIYIQPQNEYSDHLLFPRAMVSTDNYWNQVNFPFFISKDFEGTIDAETHFLSVFFVKRENSEMIKKSYTESNNRIDAARNMIDNWGRYFYKKNNRK